MKKFAKMIALALALCMILAACGAPKEPQKESQPASDASENLSEESKNESKEESKALEEGADSSAIYEAGKKALGGEVLRVGTSADFPPFEYYDKNEMVGIDVDILKAVGEKMGLEVKFQDMDFKAILAAIGSGKLDAGVAAISVTEERKKTVDFSDPYNKTILKILVTKDSPLKTPDDLKDHKVGTQLGTTGEAYAKDDFGEENVQSFNKYNDAVMALSKGKVDAVIMDEEPAKNYAQAAGLSILDSAYAEEEYSIAFGKGKEDLIKAVNLALKELREEGTLDQIVSKYIHD